MFVFTYPKRENLCRSASGLTRIILAEDRVWMGVGWGQDTQVVPCGLLSGVFTLPTQDANSKGALAVTVSVLVPGCSKKGLIYIILTLLLFHWHLILRQKRCV